MIVCGCAGEMSTSFDTLEQVRFGKKGRSGGTPSGNMPLSASVEFELSYGDLQMNSPRKSQLLPLESTSRSHLAPLSSGPGLMKLEPLGTLALFTHPRGACHAVHQHLPIVLRRATLSAFGCSQSHYARMVCGSILLHSNSYVSVLSSPR